MVGSDKIDVGAKGLAGESGREGIFFARFRRLSGIMKVKDGEKNFDILGARKKFDAYVPGETPLDLKSGANQASEKSGSDAPEKAASGKRRSQRTAPASLQDAFGNFQAE
jgi:hypothetical protein